MDQAAVHDPNLDYLYLNDMLADDHPMYEEMKRRYKKSPQGQRLQLFKAENEKYRDGLHIANHGKLDNIILSENVPYTEDPTDRIAKINAIRLRRSQLEDQKLKMMTTEERKAYLDEAKRRRKEDEQHEKDRLSVDRAGMEKRKEKRVKHQNAMQEFMYKQRMERREQQERNRQFLKDDLARRSGKVNPVHARDLAVKEREAKEQELAEAVEKNDQAALAEQAKTTPPPPPPADTETQIKAPGAQEQAAKKQAAIQERKDARLTELSGMGKGKLDELMDAGKLTIKIGMTNQQKAQAILDAEYPIK